VKLDHKVGNRELVKLARHQLMRKIAFVGGNDPAMTGDPSGGMGGGGAGGMPMDPAMMGMDPAMMGGGGGGAAPPPPSGLSREEVQAMISQAMQSGGGGAMGAGGEMIKPKIDVNVELMQIKNLLAKLCDVNGVQIPAEMMVATPEKLTAMAQGSAQGGVTQGAGAGGGSGMGAIPPMEGMQGSGVPGGGGGEKSGQIKKAFKEQGRPFDAPELLAAKDRASAIQTILAQRKSFLKAS